LSFRQLKPSTAKLKDGTVFTTPDEKWQAGSTVFYHEGPLAGKSVSDGTFILKDSTAIEIKSGKVSSINSVNTITNSPEPALAHSDKWQISKSLSEGNYWWLAIAIVIGILSHVIRAYRWLLLVKPMGFNARFLNSFFAVMIGYMVNYGVPRLGEISRCTVLDRYEKIPFTKAFGTVVAERVLDLIFFFIIFFIMLFTQYTEIGNYMDAKIYPPLKEKWHNLLANKMLLSILIGGFVMMFGALYYFRKKITGKFSEKARAFFKGFSEGLSSVKKVKNPVSFIFLTAMIWVCYYGVLHVCFLCLPGSQDLGFSEAITAFVFGSVTVMITPGGIGAYPYALQKVLNYVYGVPEAIGVSIGWLSWLSGFISTVSIGLLALVILPLYNKNRHFIPATNEQQS
jgi:glycosyltransferase 2 family protein